MFSITDRPRFPHHKKSSTCAADMPFSSPSMVRCLLPSTRSSLSLPSIRVLWNSLQNPRPASWVPYTGTRANKRSSGRKPSRPERGCLVRSIRDMCSPVKLALSTSPHHTFVFRELAKLSARDCRNVAAKLPCLSSAQTRNARFEVHRDTSHAPSCSVRTFSVHSLSIHGVPLSSLPSDRSCVVSHAAKSAAAGYTLFCHSAALRLVHFSRRVLRRLVVLGDFAFSALASTC